MLYLETTPSAIATYKDEKLSRVTSFGNDTEFKALSNAWSVMALKKNYMNNFSWLGRPLIQLPSDAMALQEIIWSVKPDLIIETGIAHGGSLILSASMLELIGHGEVIGIDIDIRPHNKKAIEEHPLFKRITLLEGSSTSEEIIKSVQKLAKDKTKILVCLDSNHTHEHVLKELNLYAQLVSKESYCIVLDTFIEDMPEDFVWENRDWGKGNNPKTAIWEWLKTHPEFQIDRSMENKLMVTSAPDGFLRRIN